jgi:hypothetical protein
MLLAASITSLPGALMLPCAFQARAGNPAAVPAAMPMGQARGQPPAGLPAAQAVSPDPHWPEAPSVNELMQAELRAALLVQRQRAAGKARSAMAANSAAGDAGEPAHDRVDLAAIYGVGKRLNVEVIVNGQTRQYAHGKKWPDGGAGIKDAYALVAIDGRCVKLDGAGGTRTVCLQGRAEDAR